VTGTWGIDECIAVLPGFIVLLFLFLFIMFSTFKLAFIFVAMMLG